MNKIILASAVAVAAASGAYFYKVGLNTQADDFLAYVPADTPLISLQTNAINHYEYLSSMGYQNESFARRSISMISPQSKPFLLLTLMVTSIAPAMN